MNRLQKIPTVILIMVISTLAYQLYSILRMHPLQIKSIHRNAFDNRSDNDEHSHETNTTEEDYKIIAAYVQDKLYDLQNPKICESAKKVVCDLRRGLYKTEDIQVIHIDYGPTYIELGRSIPENIRKRVIRFHSDPQLWWAGQMASYILRPTIRLQNLIAKKKKSFGFKNVIVGVQIRRTDKLKKEAKLYNVTDYIMAAETWFNIYEQRTGKAVKTRNIFLVTDEPSVVTEAKLLFPNYTFINDMNATKAASNYERRLKYSSLKTIINDIFLLSMCDYIVCTMSSNICRLAFELMQLRHKDGSKYAKSLDCEYYIHNLYKGRCRRSKDK